MENVDENTLFCRHTDIDTSRESLLCLHGLGDSGHVFRDAFLEAGLQDYNIIAPDLRGYGKSRSKHDKIEDFTFENQIAGLYKLMDRLGIEQFFLVGHSMGGDIGTLMCTEFDQGRVRAFVNVEGDLTEDDRFITNAAFQAHAKGKEYFEHWLKYELIKIIFADDRASLTQSKEHYQKSLAACSPVAFWENVKEIRSLNENIEDLKYAKAARLFTELHIPKVFCCGKESIRCDSETGKYLKSEPFPQLAFDAFHWIMLDQPKEFYNSLAKFFREQG